LLFHNEGLVILLLFLIYLLELLLDLHLVLLQVRHLTEPRLARHRFVLNLVEEVGDAVVVFFLLALALFALLRHSVRALRLVFVDCKSVEDLPTALEGTLHEPELAQLVAVDHDVGQSEVVLATFLGTLEGGLVVRLLHERMDRANLLGGGFAGRAPPLVVVFLQAVLANGLLAALALNGLDGEHLAIGAGQHGKDLSLAGIKWF
jgi:hypothetical protein